MSIINIQNLLIGIMILSYIIPFVFVKTRKEQAISKIVAEARGYKEIQNFIDSKKDQFNKYEKFSFFIIGLFITLFIAKDFLTPILNMGAIGPLAYIIFVMGFIANISTYFHLRPVENKIISELYKLKDSLTKSK